MQPRRQDWHGSISTHQRQELDNSLEEAKTKLVTQPGSGPFVLASNVSQSIFDAWDDDGKAAWHIAYSAPTKSLLMYGDPGPVHARLRGRFLAELSKQAFEVLKQVAGLSSKDSSYEQQRKAAQELGELDPFGGSTMYTDLGAKSPDASFYPAGFGARSLILEIAHRNESFAALKQEVAFWHAAGIGLVLGIFIDPTSDNSDPNLILLKHAFGSSTTEQQCFGRLSGCTKLGMPEFQLQLPVKLLLDSKSDEVLKRHISLDLYQMQQKLIDWLHVQAAAQAHLKKMPS